MTNVDNEAVRHQRLRVIFDEAVTLDTASRAAYLRATCDDDPAMRERVGHLLDAHDRAASFLEMPARILFALHTHATFSGTDRFRIIRELGRGGMGVVYEVHDAERDEVVALKTLQRHSPVDLYRLKREFRGLGDLAHPNIVCLHELFVEDDHPFFTMEMVRGHDFRTYIRGGGGVDRSRLFGALRQLADGLSELHATGRLHRDIKPSNVMVTTEGRVVILDFGLIAEASRVADRVTGGTPAYMSPEECAGRAPSPASDWYSAGVTLYEALTGHLPFTGAPESVIQQKQNADPAPPSNVGVDAAVSDLCMKLLARDPSLRGNGDAILRTVPHATVPQRQPDRTPFIGRSEPLRLLHEARAEVSRGATRIAAISGPSGIGKTTLVRHFLDEVEQSVSAVILAGRCYENESVPYKALDGAVDSLSQHLSLMARDEVDTLVPGDCSALTRVFPVLRRIDQVRRASGTFDTRNFDAFHVRRRAMETLRDLLRRLAERRPLVLWIDDVQWADPDSLQLLDELLSPDPLPILTAMSFRGEALAAKPLLRAWFERRQGDTITIELQPMAEAEAESLVDRLLEAGGLGDHQRAHITREGAGNPYVLEQLARYAGDISQPSAVSLSAMFDARLAALSPAARQLLQTLAVCGRPMPVDVICTASGVDTNRHDTILGLRAARLIRSGAANRIEPYHDRIREALARTTGPEAIRAIHRHVAAALVERGSDDCEALFEHYHGAGDASRAAEQAAIAGDKAADSLAFDRAAYFYQQALSVAPAGLNADHLRRHLADALSNAGRPEEAAAAYLDAAAHAPDAAQVTLQRAAAEQFLIGGHIDRGLSLLNDVLNRVGLRFARTPRAAAVRLMWHRARLWWRGLHFTPRDEAAVSAHDLLRLDACWAAAAGLALVDIVSASDFVAQHLYLALDAGEPSRIAKGLALEAAARHADWMTRSSAGRYAKASAELSGRLKTPHALAMESLADSLASCATGQWRRALVSSERTLATLREKCVGVTWETTIAQNTFIWSLMYRGQLGDLSRRMPALMSDARRRGNLYLATEFATRANFVWLAADDPDGGGRETTAAIERWSQKGFHRQHFSGMLARAQTALYLGDGPTAWRHLVDHEAGLRASLLMRVQALRIEYWYLRGRCAIATAIVDADRPRWLTIARKCARGIAREEMAWSTPLSRLLDASIAAADGDGAAAASALRDAIPAFDRADMQLYAHVARRRLGEVPPPHRDDTERRKADEWMAAQQIKNPAALTRMLSPGFPESWQN